MSFSVALLISTYNWPQALELVLQSVKAQTVLPDKILIADDGSDEKTKKVIQRFQQQLSTPVVHTWHPDNGFRKVIVMNKAIAGSNCDYIIQIDGDIVMHPEFIADHISEAEPGFYIKGSRTMLNANKTQELIVDKSLEISIMDRRVTNKFNGLRLPFFSRFLRRKSRRSRDFKGCNCAFWRNDFIKVNGYNNDFQGWGHEDIEFAARLVNAGIMQKRIKLKAVCYHLFHKLNDRCFEDKNLLFYERTVREGFTESINGYKQLI